jgi:hypothetical protein
MTTHFSYAIPIVTFGSAGDYFKTGLYCDYRNVGASQASITTLQPSTTYCGVLYAQWLANVLQAMGVQPAEFELWKDSSGNVQHGYGLPFVCEDYETPAYQQHYQNTSSPYFTGASGPLPFIKGV